MSDLISREAVLERAEACTFTDKNEKIKFMDWLEHCLEQPTIKAEPQWIPCSERLPNKDEYLKNDGRFIVTDGNRVYQSIYDIYFAHCFRTLVLFDFGFRSDFEVDNCVIAWQPLPEPYKGEQHETD